MHLVATGDEDAFEQLYRHYRNKAYSVALTYMTVPALAEDVLQDFFLKLWKKRAVFSEIVRFDQYLFIMLRNMLISELRKHERQQGIRQHIRESVLTLPTPDELTQAENLRETIYKALQSLPRKQQEIYRMSREQGMDHDEIAGILDISPRTVSNNITFVLNHLRNTLREQGYLAETITVAIILFS